MTAWVLAPPGPSNFPVGSTPGFQPTMVPSSVANRKTAGAVCVPSVILNAPLPRAMLNTVPVGVPLAPVGSPGAGMLTTNGCGMPAVSKRVDTPALLSATQNGPLVGASEMPQGLTR